MAVRNATMSACEKGRRWQRALGLLEEMANQGLHANANFSNRLRTWGPAGTAVLLLEQARRASQSCEEVLSPMRELWYSQ